MKSFQMKKRSQDLEAFSQYTVNVSHFIEVTIKDKPIIQEEGRGKNAKAHITNLYYIECRVFPLQSARDVVPHPIRELRYITAVVLHSANDAEALIGGVK